MKTSMKSILGGRVEVIGPAAYVDAIASHIATTITPTAAAVQPLKPALDDETVSLPVAQAAEIARLTELLKLTQSAAITVAEERDKLRLLVQSLADSRILGGPGAEQYRRLANESAREALK